ncbi:MAG: AI-2E family transporter [Thermoplasmatota archaeon]
MLSKRRLSPWFLLALVLLMAWLSLRIVGVFGDYVAIGLFLAYLTHPLYKRMLPKLRSKSLTALTLLLIIGATVLVPLGFLIAELVRELTAIAASLNVQNLEAVLQDAERRIYERMGRTPPDSANGGGFLQAIVPTLNQFAGDATRDLVRVLGEGIIGIFVLLYVQYYATIDGERLIRWVHGTLPMQEAHRDLLFHEVGLVVHAVMYGQVLTALIQAALAAFGFWIFGVPNVAFWSVITFILALLPVIGPPLIWGPWGIYLIILGRTFDGIGLLVYSAVLVSTMDNIIRPKLIGSRAQVHPVVVLLGVLGGLVVFGFSGFVLGPLVLSVFVTLLNVYRKEFAQE